MSGPRGGVILLFTVLVVAAFPTFAWTSAVAVVWVRCFDPPWTHTMLDRIGARVVDTWRPTWVGYAAVPLEAHAEALPRAAVGSEDARFFLHNGFDYEAICRALESNRAGGRLVGGSTISQQVARNVFLWQDRSWTRKGLEAWYTLWLELLVPKDRILELYLNIAETGPLVFGFDAAAMHWYGVHSSALSEEQARRLVWLLPDPDGRVPTGQGAAKKARWLRAHPAPFPGDAGFDRVVDAWGDSPGPGCAVWGLPQ